LLRPKNAPSAAPKAKMPAEKLSTSISKPARTLPFHRRSICLKIHAESGPAIIAPRIMTRSGSATMTPIAVTAPMTPPRQS